MNLEAITLYQQSQYLAQQINGARISKIFMPNANSLLIQVYKNGVQNLLCDLGGNGPALYLTDVIPENPDTPPAFCMLLRKHLEEGRIAGIEQKNFDRIIAITIDVLENNNKITTKELIFELTGRINNIIFTIDGKIIDCLRHIGSNNNHLRTILPTYQYQLPPCPQKMHPLAIEAEKLANAIQYNQADNLTLKIMNTLAGIGKHTATLLAQADNLTEALKNLQKKFYTAPDDSINSYIKNEMAKKPTQPEKKTILQQIVQSEITKNKKRMTAVKQDLTQANNAETERIIADTLMANLQQIHKGETLIQLPSIYDDTILQIKLNPELSPNDNAQAYYKRYNKYKRAKSELKKQISQAQELLDYLQSIATSLQISTTKQELEEINEELINIGIIKKNKKKRIPSTASQPLHLQITNGDIYIGKNNRQNDWVTFKIGKPQDLWFHTKDIPGSHVILQGEHSDTNIAAAQLLAAWFSQGRQGSNIPVDMVERKFVKKPSGAKPGFVIFTNNRTSYVNIDEEKIKELLK